MPGDPYDFEESPRAGGTLASILVAACLATAAAWGCCAFGALIATDAGMPQTRGRFDTFLLALMGLAAGLLARVAGSAVRRIAPVVATLGGTTLGVMASGYRGGDVVLRVAVVALAVTVGAFAAIERLGRRW